MRLTHNSITMPRFAGRPAKRAGFSLIELMMVMGIIVLIMGIGIPAFVHALQKAPLQEAVSDVMDACNEARAQAIIRGVPTTLVFEAEGGVIRVEADGGGQGAAQTPFSKKLPDTVFIKMLDVNFQDRLKEADAKVRFYPNGTSDELTVVLNGAEGQIRKISLNVITAVADLEVLK